MCRDVRRLEDVVFTVGSDIWIVIAGTSASIQTRSSIIIYAKLFATLLKNVFIESFGAIAKPG